MDVAFKQFLEQMTRDQKLSLIKALKAAIADDIANEPGDPDRCPHCGCEAFVKKGLSRGSQRWLCHGCARTFGRASNGLLATSKLEAAVWMTFAECMADALSLRETAMRCGVSLYTSWFMRMRVCEVMKHALPKARKGAFHVDGTHVVDNLSGNHAKSWFELPRKRHRNGRDGRRGRGGRPKDRVCCVCGINEYGDCFCEAVDYGTASKTGIGLLVQDRIPRGSTVVTDGHLSYAGSLVGATHVVVDPEDPSTGSINMVNSLHSRLKSFLAKFNGVSTRRLERYLDRFSWIEQHKAEGVDRRQVVYACEANGRYLHTRRLTHLALHKIDLYWNRRMVNEGFSFMSTVV